MKAKAVKAQGFQFVSVIPSATDGASKAALRRLVRSNAANYQWSRQKRKRKLPLKEPIDQETITASQSGSCGSSKEEVPYANHGGHDHQITRISSARSGTNPNTPELSSVYETLSLLPENGIAHLMRFNIQYIIPHLVPHISKGVENPVAPSWIQLAMQSPALYHTWMYCSAVYYDALRPWFTPSEVCERDILFVQSRAIGLLNEEMQNLATAPNDENLLAVLGMAVHGREVITVGKKAPNQGPLRDLQGLELYSLMKPVPLHLDGLALLVEMRGGVEAIQSQRIGAIISYMGMVQATKTLTKPRWPFVPLGRILVPLESLNTISHPSHPLRHLGTDFPLEKDDWEFQPLSDLFSVIRAMCGYTIMVSDHCEGREFQESLCSVADQRNSIHHQLISLPHNPMDNPEFYDDGMYEVTRLAAVIYSFLVIFPASAVSLPFTEIACRLRRQLSHIDISNKTPHELRFVVWMLFMGGIAAIGSDERPWFIGTLALLSEKLPLYAWVDVRQVLQTFLWLGSTNDVDGRELWTEVTEMQFLNESDISMSWPQMSIMPMDPVISKSISLCLHWGRK